MSQTSAACCSVPAVVASEKYEEQGHYIDLAGKWKTYVTGDEKSTRGIFVIYDVFGYFKQTLQGSDILAHKDTKKPTLVVMPDILNGVYADIEWFPPNNEEKKKKLGAYFQETAIATEHAARIPTILAALKKEFPSVTSWALLGYCFGAKVAILNSFEGTPFKACAVAHPAFIDAEDAPKVTIPIVLLPSKDEDKNDLGGFAKALTVKHKMQWFPNSVHGFMAARADLSDAKTKATYEEGYQTVLQFFHENL